MVLSDTLIMGILNVTPDSFSDGSIDVDVAVQRARIMLDEGADIIDIGGESSKPGSDPVSEEEELSRVVPVLKRLSGVPISIDTCKSRVAKKCVELGARMINDISGLRDPNMIKIAAKAKVPVVIMHMKGEPKSMQENVQYDNVVLEIKDFFADRVARAKLGGVNDIILDPGIGFGKRLEDNLEILRNLSVFKELGYPILIGPSRKSFIGEITGEPVDQRLEGSIAACIAGVMNGANIVRVHDVEEVKRAVKVADAIKEVS